MLNKPLDPHLANPPTLNLASSYYLKVFNILGTCRAIGFGGIGPIPYTAMSAYCHDHGIEGDELEALVNIVNQLDEATLGDK